MYHPYLMFVADKYFKPVNCFGKRPDLVDVLTNKGITVKRLSEADHQYSYNDFFVPQINVLYVHLINGEYYSDDLYNKKKRDKERDILFLLAAKLGVENISYETEITETAITAVESLLNAKYFKNSIVYSKDTSSKKGQSGNETYLNRGAPVYTLSSDLEQVEKNIRKKFNSLDSKVFSYRFYEQNSNLRTFVYKRFNFKMLSLEYATEDEDISEKTFEIRSLLMGYGIGLKFDKIVSVSERITYSMDFFTDKELRIKLNKIIRLKNDEFAGVRELYDAEEDKDIAVYRIVEYVKKFTKTLFYHTERDPYTRRDYYGDLNDWIKRSRAYEFEDICKKFTSSYQIRTWLQSTLGSDNDVIVDADIEKGGVLSLKQREQGSRSMNDLNTQQRQLEMERQYEFERQCEFRNQEIEETSNADEEPSLTVGTRVEVKYKGKGKWYKGKIAKVNTDSSYDIHYDDGDKERGASREFIKVIDNGAPIARSLPMSYDTRDEDRRRDAAPRLSDERDRDRPRLSDERDRDRPRLSNERDRDRPRLSNERDRDRPRLRDRPGDEVTTITRNRMPDNCADIINNYTESRRNNDSASIIDEDDFGF